MKCDTIRYDDTIRATIIKIKFMDPYNHDRFVCWSYPLLGGRRPGIFWFCTCKQKFWVVDCIIFGSTSCYNCYNRQRTKKTSKNSSCNSRRILHNSEYITT